MACEITLEATIENVGKATEFVDRELEKCGCPMKAQTQINIAIDEIFGNVANYAYQPGTGDATVRLEILEEPPGAVLTFIDAGRHYDPLEMEDPDVSLPVEEREIGGLGIYLVKQTMDEVFYEYRDGRNILTIIKRWDRK